MEFRPKIGSIQFEKGALNIDKPFFELAYGNEEVLERPYTKHEKDGNVAGRKRLGREAIDRVWDTLQKEKEKYEKALEKEKAKDPESKLEDFKELVEEVGERPKVMRLKKKKKKPSKE